MAAADQPGDGPHSPGLGRVPGTARRDDAHRHQTYHVARLGLDAPVPNAYQRLIHLAQQKGPDYVYNYNAVAARQIEVKREMCVIGRVEQGPMKALERRPWPLPPVPKKLDGEKEARPGSGGLFGSTGRPCSVDREDAGRRAGAT